MTTDLESRVLQHKTKRFAGFTARYNCNRLLYFEQFEDVSNAIAREKQVKGWRREKKLALIRTMSPEMRDLAADWFAPDLLDAVSEMSLKDKEAASAEVLRLRGSQDSPLRSVACQASFGVSKNFSPPPEEGGTRPEFSPPMPRHPRWRAAEYRRRALVA
ncbi:MAG TPA: GIY-YIG nuclease family protein [Fimbriimonadaceae bacterium]|nr:GIY-YIG nuclease family protein [Fimbriimonadaceae bacterium]